MSNLSKVYVTQVPSKLIDGSWVPSINIAPASEYGEVDIMLPASHSQFMSAQLVHTVHQKLKDFDPDADYLLPTGDPLIYTVAVAVLARRHSKFRILKWDKIIRRYTSHMVAV